MKKTTKRAGKQKKGASAARKATREAVAQAATAMAEAGPPKKSRAQNSAGEPKAKRVSALDAAAEVLRKAGKPMRSQEMIAAMAEQGLWTSPAGKTPHSTLYAAMMREARDKGGASRFRKVDRGQFAFNG